MTRPIPIIPTLIVATACAIMVGLGVWQMQRAAWKDRLLAQYAQAPQRPEMAFPIGSGVPQTYLFRRAGANCLEPAGERIEFSGRKNNVLSYRHMVRCRTGAEGPGFLVDIGWSSDSKMRANWKGGVVTGVISEAPTRASLIAQFTGNAPPAELMLIADTPAPGLKASTPPDLSDIPNNHLAYAVQWFLFAGVAALIYILALRRKAA